MAHTCLNPARVRLAVLVLFSVAIFSPPFSIPLRAQPTYKLDVKPDLKPLATIKLEGAKVTRGELSDDPGFRLQFHVKAADGKNTITTSEARSNRALELPVKDAGTFTIVLELFYPAYKGGTGQKGEFKPVSNVLRYKVEEGKVTLLEPPIPKKTDADSPKKP
jgi:hypothetical protein